MPCYFSVGQETGIGFLPREHMDCGDFFGVAWRRRARGLFVHFLLASSW
jgi:hypothetical protein